jgi:hypothetical protein
MKTFKQLISEENTKWEISWLKHVMDHVFNRPTTSSCFMLVHPAIIKKVYGGHTRIVGYHTTDVIGLERLLAIQGGNKTISTFTKIGPFMIGDLGSKITGDYNYKTKNGYDNTLLVKVSGNLMVANRSDMMSKPEGRGIRGFEYGDPSFCEIIYDFVNDKIEWYKQKYPKLVPDTVEEYRTKYSSSFYGDDDTTFIQIVKKNHPRLIPEWYAEYYQLVLKWLLYGSNRIEFAMEHRSTYESIHSSYNEVLLSHIKVESVLNIAPVFGNSMTKSKLDKLQKKYGFEITVASKTSDIKNYLNMKDDKDENI